MDRLQLQPCKRSLLHGRRDKSIDLHSHHVQDPGSTPLRFTTLRVSSLLCFRSRLRTAYCGTEKSSFVGFLCLQGKTSFFFFFFYATVTLLDYFLYHTFTFDLHLTGAVPVQAIRQHLDVRRRLASTLPSLSVPRGPGPLRTDRWSRGLHYYILRVGQAQIFTSCPKVRSEMPPEPQPPLPFHPSPTPSTLPLTLSPTPPPVL